MCHTTLFCTIPRSPILTQSITLRHSVITQYTVNLTSSNMEIFLRKVTTSTKRSEKQMLDGKTR